MKYTVTLLLNDGWKPQKVKAYSAADDEAAKKSGISIANNYIYSGERPLLISAFVSRWEKISRWSQGMWLHVCLLQRGRDLYTGNRHSCLQCNGKGWIAPRQHSL